MRRSLVPLFLVAALCASALVPSSAWKKQVRAGVVLAYNALAPGVDGPIFSPANPKRVQLQVRYCGA